MGLAAIVGSISILFFHSVRLSISGSWIAHWSDDRELTVWEREHHRGAMTFSRVDRAAFSSDEKEIVAMYRDDGQVAVIRLCDGQTRTVVAGLQVAIFGHRLLRRCLYNFSC